MIEVEHLTKRYGTHLAVSDLSFQIESGQIYGFLGPNGAGKSTTMNIMTGCLSATEGHVRIGGHDIFDEPEKAKRLIGYLPEQPPLYQNETPLEYLRFVGEAKGLHGTELTAQIADAVARTGIEKVQNRKIAALSKGYKQRVGIAQALLGKPEPAADGAVTLRLKTDSDDIRAVSRSIFFAFAGADTALLELSVRKASLEDVFLELTESGPAEVFPKEEVEEA